MTPDRLMPRQILARPYSLRSLKVSILTCLANVALSGLFAVAFLRLIPYFTFFTFLIFYRISSPFAIARLSQRPKIFRSVLHASMGQLPRGHTEMIVDY